MALFVDLAALSNGLHGSVQMDSVALFLWIGWLRHHGILNSFLRECRNNGLHQVIITSEMMIELVKTSYADFGRKISKIEFMEEDSEADEYVNCLLKVIESNPYQLTKLLDYLMLIAEKSSVEIKRIYIKGPYVDGKADSFFVQSNGIIGINRESYDLISKEICTFTERCLFE